MPLKYQLRVVFSFIVLLLFPLCGFAQTTPHTSVNKEYTAQNITLLVPADKGFPFWDSVVDYAQATSEALNASLTVYYIPRSVRTRFDIVSYSFGLIQKNEVLPDLVISSLWLGAEEAFLEALERLEINSITINSQVPDKVVDQIGQPREKYRHWLGHLSPDDAKVGYDLANHLLALKGRDDSCEPKAWCYNVFAVSGFSYATVTEQRNQGLKKAIAENQGARLFNIVNGNWKRKDTASLMPRILSRHQDIDIFWASSDIMAYGIIDGIEEAGLFERDNILVGSIDWSPDSIDLIRQGKLAISLGGHFMEGGWAIQLYYAYLAGSDFVNTLGTRITTHLSPLTLDNINDTGKFLEKPTWDTNVFLKWQENARSHRKYEFSPEPEIYKHYTKSSK